LHHVRNAKVATGSTLLWLYRLHSGDHGFTPAKRIDLQNKLPRAWDVGWGEVLRMLDGEAFRFSFVRDPVRRVESAYFSKVMKHRRYPGRAALQETLGLPVGRDEQLTFEQFIAAIERKIRFGWTPTGGRNI
jgi:sulfotransferase famil protein